MDTFVAVDTDAPRRGSDSGVIRAVDPPTTFLVAALASASVAGGLVGVGVSDCGQAETRGARDGGASNVGFMDVLTAAVVFGWSAGWSGG